MHIIVQLEAQLREAAGVNQEAVEVEDGSHLLHAVNLVAQLHAEALGSRLLTESGGLQRGLLVFINDQPIAPAAAGERRLNDGDTVLLCPPISGG